MEQKRTIKDIIKDNKKEILIFGGSAAMLALGVYCLTKDAVSVLGK